MTPDSGITLLLAEDFDRHLAVPQPDIGALLAQARAEARADLAASFDASGHAAQEALACACTELAANLAPALAALDEAVTETARSLTRAMITAVTAALPGWSQTLAPQASAEVVMAVTQALGDVATPRLFTAPADTPTLRALLPAGIAIEADDTMASGALRLAWCDGRAIRDPASIWSDIITTLDLALAPSAAPAIQPTRDPE